MSYVQEQLTKTFEYLLRLHQHHHNSANTSFVSTRKSRTLYRIDQDKLKKYRAQYDGNQPRLSNENTKLYLEEKQTITSFDRKTTSTQTVFDKEIHLPIDLSSNATDITHESHYRGETESINTLSSSSSSIKKTTATTISSPSSAELDFHTDSTSQTSTEITSKPKSTNCGVYMRSIVRYMSREDMTDEEQPSDHKTLRNKQIET